MRRYAWGTAVLVAVASGGYLSLRGSGQSQSASRAKRGCELAITSPALEPGGRLLLASGDALAITLQGTALRCPSSTVTMFAKVGAGAETQVGTPSTNASGAWSFPYTVTDGTTTILRAQMTSAAGKTTSASVTVEAGTGKPKIAVTAPRPDEWGKVRIVAPAADAGCGGGGNAHADLGEPGYVYDQGCAAGGQVNPNITVTGGSPGTLTVWYADAGIASANVTTSPQTFTTAELGQWTLPEWSRSDLVLTATGPGGTTTKTLMARVATVSPPPLQAPDGGVGPYIELKHARHADVNVSFLLPTPPPQISSATITVGWSTSTNLRTSDVSLGSVVVGNTPTALPAVPGTCQNETVNNGGQAGDAGYPLWCSTRSDVTPDTGYLVWKPTNSGFGWTAQSWSAQLEGDAGPGWGNACGNPSEPKATVYCVGITPATTITVSASGCCRERTHAVFDNAKTGHREEACQFYDGVWHCADDKDHQPGTPYTVELKWIPPMNTIYFDAELSW